MSAPVLIVVLVALAALAWLSKPNAPTASRRRRGTTLISEPSTRVHVLRSGAELQEAIERARHYDEKAEEVLRRRVERYTAVSPGRPGTLVALRTCDGSDEERHDQKTA